MWCVGQDGVGLQGVKTPPQHPAMAIPCLLARVHNAVEAADKHVLRVSDVEIVEGDDVDLDATEGGRSSSSRAIEADPQWLFARPLATSRMLRCQRRLASR